MKLSDLSRQSFYDGPGPLQMNTSPVKAAHSSRLRERFHSTNFTRRRFWGIVTVFLFLTIILFIRSSPYRTSSAWADDEILGRPGVVYPPQDEWKPPPDWDPVYPVYTNFTKLDDRYSSSITNLTTKRKWSAAPEAQEYHPYPRYESEDYKRRFRGAYVPCVGPRGKRLNESVEDAVNGYIGSPEAFPVGPIGSSKEVGFDDNVCFERHGRFGAYGSSVHGKNPGKATSPLTEVNWDQVDWASLQSQCTKDNSDRFDMGPRPQPGDSKYQELAHDSYRFGDREDGAAVARQAVIFRSYDGMKYTSDMLRTMRSVITELALGSGGEYEAFLLVQIKDETSKIFEDPVVYNETIRKSVPKEFWNMTVLWHTGLWGKQYPKLPEGSRNVHVSQWLPIQYFQKKYPAFDYYWNWEMDFRYTGHHYEMLESLISWSRKQPRKGLWERNARFYVPRYHGDYATEFTDYVQNRYQAGSGKKKQDSTIWGPLPPAGQATTYLDDLPPLDAPTPSQDNFTWGVGEEADLITLLPMFNPDTTHYTLRGGHFNYPLTLLPAGPPRRATIITFYRLSHRLLGTMEQENVHSPGHHMSSEQWPQSMCLHHGFKAVYAPHSLYMEREWPAKALNFIFNNGDSQRVIKAFKDMPALGEGSGGWESVFGLDREHNFMQSTWYFRTDLATRLYKRLLGYEVDGIGGDTWEAQHGTYCLPPMLLHQIKDMEDPALAAADGSHELLAGINEAQFQKEKATAESEALKAADAGGADVPAP